MIWDVLLLVLTQNMANGHFGLFFLRVGVHHYRSKFVDMCI